MRNINFSDLKITNIAFHQLRDKAGIFGSMNQPKMTQNPEQFQLLLQMASARFDKMFQRVGPREFKFIGKLSSESKKINSHH